MKKEKISDAKFKPPVYIAGPMNNLQNFNYPAFHAVEQRLAFLGVEYFTPTMGQDPPDAYDESKPYSFYLKQAIGELFKCESILLLPDWHTSKGAVIEHDIAVALDMTVMIWLNNDEVVVVRP